MKMTRFNVVPALLATSEVSQRFLGLCRKVPRTSSATPGFLPLRGFLGTVTTRSPRQPSQSTLVSGKKNDLTEYDDKFDDKDDFTSVTAGSLTVPSGDRLVFSRKVCLRPATVDDLETLLKWDEAEHLQDCMGDNDYNDWDWSSELRRDPSVPWRHQLIAEVFVSKSVDETGGEPSGPRKPIGVVQVIDPALEESRYWALARKEDEWDRSDTVFGTNELEEFDFANMPPFEHRAIDIWIGEEDCLGAGYGTEMMQLTLDHYCFGGNDGTCNANVTTVWVDPMADNVLAHRFYQRFGFRPFGIRYFGPDRTLVHKLDRATWEELRKAK